MVCPAGRVIRIVKALTIIGPLTVMFLTISLIENRGGSPTVITTTPSSYEIYVQKEGLCSRNLQAPVPNSTDTHALSIYKACQWLRGLERSFYSKYDRVIHPFEHKFLISGETICTNDTDVILIIHSYHPYYDRRKAIRETWGGATIRNTWPKRELPMTVKLVFMFGLHMDESNNVRIQTEGTLFGDIVQGDFYDSYKNMTLKSLMGLKWVSEYCPNAKYLVKSDDDMIINFPYLQTVLRQTNMTWSIMGPLNMGAKVYRFTSKWALPESSFPFFFFPPYESGSTYVINRDLVRPLFQTAQYVPRIFVDDVYITGILGKILNVRHKQQAGFAYWTNKAPAPCDVIQDKVLTGTRMFPRLQYDLWSRIIRNKNCQYDPL